MKLNDAISILLGEVDYAVTDYCSRARYADKYNTEDDEKLMREAVETVLVALRGLDDPDDL